MIKPKVLFLCGANSCRTQMAQGFLSDLAGDRFEVMSAGFDIATEVCPDAIEAMREVGIDISHQRPKTADQFIGQRIAYVINVCDREKERSCPIFPGAFMRLTWPLDDPLKADSSQQRRRAVCEARDEIRSRVIRFVSENT